MREEKECWSHAPSTSGQDEAPLEPVLLFSFPFKSLVKLPCQLESWTRTLRPNVQSSLLVEFVERRHVLDLSLLSHDGPWIQDQALKFPRI